PRSAASTVCIVQALFGANAAPDKLMAPLGGEPALAHVLRRCRAIPGIDQVVCATVAGPAGEPIAALANRLDAAVFRGAPADALAHYHAAAIAAGAGIVLRVTSDCPLIDPQICGELLRLRMAEDADYAANNMPPSWPRGLDCEAFTVESLEEAHEIASDPADRRQVTSWIRRNRTFRRVNLAGPGGELVEQRWMLAEPEDLAFLRAIYARISNADASWREVAGLVAREPMPVNDRAGR
ncbi:MAG TPA: NTP transferase domain-containing protein, partial [Stellaceae bacterium]|nr:NTP transferase domain-containing protein [Stellaceae bacterium]